MYSSKYPTNKVIIQQPYKYDEGGAGNGYDSYISRRKYATVTNLPPCSPERKIAAQTFGSDFFEPLVYSGKNKSEFFSKAIYVSDQSECQTSNHDCVSYVVPTRTLEYVEINEQHDFVCDMNSYTYFVAPPLFEHTVPVVAVSNQLQSQMDVYEDKPHLVEMSKYLIEQEIEENKTRFIPFFEESEVDNHIVSPEVATLAVISGLDFNNMCEETNYKFGINKEEYACRWPYSDVIKLLTSYLSKDLIEILRDSVFPKEKGEYEINERSFLDFLLIAKNAISNEKDDGFVRMSLLLEKLERDITCKCNTVMKRDFFYLNSYRYSLSYRGLHSKLKGVLRFKIKGHKSFALLVRDSTFALCEVKCANVHDSFGFIWGNISILKFLNPSFEELLSLMKGDMFRIFQIIMNVLLTYGYTFDPNNKLPFFVFNDKYYRFFSSLSMSYIDENFPGVIDRSKGRTLYYFQNGYVLDDHCAIVIDIMRRTTRERNPWSSDEMPFLQVKYTVEYLRSLFWDENSISLSRRQYFFPFSRFYVEDFMFELLLLYRCTSAEFLLLYFRGLDFGSNATYFLPRM